ncbi:peptidylprolyl isomerase [Parashewanella curva]|uniref:Periplasmic chaperone PpiD n=1 Tax=Parashewanella curva TaxID=2338552 RepID=A0A3L8PV80_9GAMM|nr:peptidylprolyl isomerase [Parashewanella curva]RLV59337.1 peptidylprolyl isomerase [Parashewanella curva]
MLEKIREGSQGVIAKTILILVILSFAFAGVSSYLGSKTTVAAATVNGEEISKAELEQLYQNERNRLQQQLGEMFDTLASNDDYLKSVKKSVLERLVAQKLVDQAASNLNLTVSDAQVKQAILSEPAFQTDGHFDNDRFQAVLRQLGYQPAAFSESMRVDMTRRQLVEALIGSEFALKSEAKDIAELQGQSRDIRYAIVDAEPYKADIKVTDEQAKDYYDQNTNQFVRPEQVSLDYVELNAADFANKVNVSEEDAKTYYDEHKNQYQTTEKRLPAHILIPFGDDEAAAKSKIEAIKKELDNGADFAELAKKDSQDTFSAKNGGKLDWYEQGVMDPAFDDALFKLKKGQVSGIVKSEFGFHLIKLLDEKPVQTQAFADVKADIEKELKKRKADDEFYSLQQKLADTSYEVPDTLEDAAKAVNAKVMHSGLFARNNPPAVLNDPKVIKAAFSEQVLDQGMNSDVIELGDNHVIVLRVNEHKVAGTKSFDEVKADIVARIKQDKANDQAKIKAEEYAASIKAGKPEVKLTTKANVHRYDRELQLELVSEVFKLSKPEQAPTVGTVELTNGYAVVALDKVNPAEGINDAVIGSLQQQLANNFSELDYRSLIAYLKSKAEITYAEDANEISELQ